MRLLREFNSLRQTVSSQIAQTQQSLHLCYRQLNPQPHLDIAQDKELRAAFPALCLRVI